MSATNWAHLLDGPRHFERLADDQKAAAHEAASNYVAELAMGISGIGNLLACTASNGVTGLSDDAAASLGWMLTAVGDLIVRLNDIAIATEPEVSQGGVNEPDAS